MFILCQPLPVGNAVQLLLRPPAAATSWRVTRNTTGAFTGPDTPGAARVAEDWGDTGIIDHAGLANGVQYWWRVDYRDAAGAWIAGAHDTASATPMAAFGGDPPDPQLLLRDRLELGLAAEAQRGRLKPSGKTGRVEVLLAPFALAENVAFPVVSCHLESAASAQRVLGDRLLPDARTVAGRWRETDGWWSRTSVNVVGVALNPGERAKLRAAIARVVVANLAVFDHAGLLEVDFSQRDHEAPQEEHNAALYLTIGTFSCLAPVFATGDWGAIEDVEVDARFTGQDEDD